MKLYKSIEHNRVLTSKKPHIFGILKKEGFIEFVENNVEILVTFLVENSRKISAVITN